jgi:hypothetical protein
MQNLLDLVDASLARHGVIFLPEPQSTETTDIFAMRTKEPELCPKTEGLYRGTSSDVPMTFF